MNNKKVVSELLLNQFYTHITKISKLERVLLKSDYKNEILSLKENTIVQAEILSDFSLNEVNTIKVSNQ